MSEVQHAETLQARDTGGYLLQIILSQHKRLKIDLLPNRFRHLTKAMLPQTEMLSRLLHIPPGVATDYCSAAFSPLTNTAD